MFGEYESESPRVPSPWDSLIPSPSSLSPFKPGSQSNGSLTASPIPTSISPRYLSPSPLLLPRLVPENDSGNVEYKLQLLNPSPARFARLVTQLKWRLLEGGGQAYYELGVADSGDLVGLRREELESSLDTLEMMAGEIGASVIVVKEIEVPEELAARYGEDVRTGGQFNAWGDARGKKSRRKGKGPMSCFDDDDSAATSSLSSTTNTETEEDSVATDDGDYADMQMTVVLQRHTASHDPMSDLADSIAVFAMDSELESDAAEAADVSEIDMPPPQYTVDLEISSVYKPRPMRKRFHHVHPGHQHHQNGSGRSGGKRGKKGEKKQHPYHSKLTQGPTPMDNGGTPPINKTLTRRQAKDRRREERKQSLLVLAARGVIEAAGSASAPANDVQHISHNTSTEPAADVQAEAHTLVEELEALHVDVGPSVPLPEGSHSVAPTPFTRTTVDDTNITVAGSMGTTVMTAEDVINHPATGQDTGGYETIHGDEDDDEIFVAPAMPISTPKFPETEDGKMDMRLIVEVLVVRKMSLEEGFLDFEGFSFV
ncbi:hypothetical protein P691DRAFT_802322 [Macrolepiota fuliginosa MF-IS2]|uniref:GTP binding protein 2 n=1 Tax=Macrolepiota fuliginosa MF-IS2 TaxID=1400762 RepID=A0A9P6C3H5_9AGAR|nr:hypothetical protein P691DRAFT_802322 [Macrolepiota fuliginosa MF-IS2]